MGMRKVAVQFGGGDRDGSAHCPVLGGTGVARHDSGRAAAGEKKERSGLQSARDELIDKGAFITGE
jgi:hypothetical protein